MHPCFVRFYAPWLGVKLAPSVALDKLGVNPYLVASATIEARLKAPMGRFRGNRRRDKTAGSAGIAVAL